MSAFKIVLAVVGVALVIVIGIGLILPRDYEVTRDIFIAQPADVIHPYVDNLERWPEWTPWHDMDETIVTTVGEIKTGVGASQSWDGNSGDGRHVITESDASTGVAYDLFFDSDKWQCKARMGYAPAEGEGTKVTWTMTGSVPIPVIGGYLSKMMSNQVGLAFADGLKKLKVLVQEEQEGEGSEEIEIIEPEPDPVPDHGPEPTPEALPVVDEITPEAPPAE